MPKTALTVQGAFIPFKTVFALEVTVTKLDDTVREMQSRNAFHV